MTRDEYAAWWMAGPDSDNALPEPINTLVEHIAALQSRIDDLPKGLRCCCAYDHPEMVCMMHWPCDAPALIDRVT